MARAGEFFIGRLFFFKRLCQKVFGLSITQLGCRDCSTFFLHQIHSNRKTRSDTSTIRLFDQPSETLATMYDNAVVANDQLALFQAYVIKLPAICWADGPSCTGEAFYPGNGIRGDFVWYRHCAADTITLGPSNRSGSLIASDRCARPCRLVV